MSTKITTIEYLTAERLTITAEAIGLARMKLLAKGFGTRLIPLESFLHTSEHLISDKRGGYAIGDVGWTGDNADWIEHLATALSFTRGSADLLLVWEGARAMQPFTGLRVVDGVVTMHQVEMSLGAEVES